MLLYPEVLIFKVFFCNMLSQRKAQMEAIFFFFEEDPESSS